LDHGVKQHIGSSLEFFCRCEFGRVMADAISTGNKNDGEDDLYDEFKKFSKK
jgi:hypothetical protein